ncbi:MAG: Secretory protein of YscJ/FliF family [Myxococcaceae bacterium]|nr:Secretory protein of YscJ/FliF family [Myxococcaceae bacterium]
MNCALSSLALLALALCSAMASFGARAHADPTNATEVPRPTLVRLAPTAASAHELRTEALERKLSSALTNWPSVQRAEVLLSLPLAAEQPLDRALPSPTATVVLTHKGDSPSTEQIFRLLHGAVPALAPTDLTVLRHAVHAARAPGPERALTLVGPFRVAPESAPGLRLALAFSLAVHALFAAIVLSRLRRHRPAARKVDPRDRTLFPP